MFLLHRKKRHPLEETAERAANIIQHQLTRLNLAYRVRRGDTEAIQRVEFVEPLIATPAEIRLEVDVNRLPRGVTITDLRKPEILETLSVACKHPVRAEHKKGKGGGFWFIAELEEQSRIPKLVRFADMKRPPDAAPLTIPIGVGANKHQQHEDLRSLPHLLIAGATQQGKSVMVNVLLCSLAARLSPARLQLYLCDLKGGVELSFYEQLPHVKRFITRAHELPTLLADIQYELERRAALLKGKARDIDGYNYQAGKGKALPYIVIVIDEIANAMLCKDRIVLDDMKTSVSAATESLLSDLAARARAMGIHLVISTQRPSVDVVTGLVKANFPCRIAFGTASEVDSRVIIDDGGAHGLPRGRMKFRRNMELLELQAPYLDDEGVRQQVAAIIAGDVASEPSPETDEDRTRREIAILLDAAESNFGGKFPIRALALHPDVMQHGIKRDRVEALARRLDKEGILQKQLGGRPRLVRLGLEQWRAIYPITSPFSVRRPASGQNPKQTTPLDAEQPGNSDSNDNNDSSEIPP